ncbi:hypothetical protein JAAARDRAFT_28478 [Jaapia argillacea MUCL 33604]|uniref:WIBG Mago-binding domain-containing protein n=1 Tax=Jaapia argillacea MUCL 33604 TaxID=933084 RepID=A0A067QMR6_9AGAM|nr:hypothetical protein JAAARDRAFT_28478 [Jaapia argillacea MUCL 33604]
MANSYPLFPEKSLAGIAVDPRTLERVIPESKRPDGSVRKEVKIRPGFTPQEDVKRFRGTKQAQMDQTQLPKGRIIGWVPPSAPKAGAGGGSGTAGAASKAAKKNAKRSEKKKAQKEADHLQKIKDSWEDDDEDEANSSGAGKGKSKEKEEGKKATNEDTTPIESETSVSDPHTPDTAGLADELDKLKVT